MPTRKGLRKAKFLITTIVLFTTGAIAWGSSFRRGAATSPVALTIEIEWSVAEPSFAELELSKGASTTRSRVEKGRAVFKRSGSDRRGFGDSARSVRERPECESPRRSPRV